MYIEREAVVKYIRSREGNFIDDMGKGWSNGMAAAASMCEKFPTADVAPVVYGEWVEKKRWAMGKWSKWLECSKCGHQDHNLDMYEDMPFVGPYNYCPNCGAKMDGDKHG